MSTFTKGVEWVAVTHTHTRAHEFVREIIYWWLKVHEQRCNFHRGKLETEAKPKRERRGFSCVYLPSVVNLKNLTPRHQKGGRGR